MNEIYKNYAKSLLAFTSGRNRYSLGQQKNSSERASRGVVLETLPESQGTSIPDQGVTFDSYIRYEIEMEVVARRALNEGGP
jgi:hypothetical protein